MNDFIKEYEKIKEIKKQIEKLKKEQIEYMTNGEMKYIREKCVGNKSITTNELFRYSKAFEISEKIINLQFELSDKKEKIKNTVEKIKEILREIKRG